VSAGHTVSRRLSRLIIFRWLSASVLTAGSVVAAEPPPLPSVPAGPVTVLELSTSAAEPIFQTVGEQFSKLLTLTYDSKSAPGPLRVETIPLDCDGVAAPTGLVESSDGTKPRPDTDAPHGITILKPEPPVWVVLTAKLPSVTTCSGQFRYKVGTQPYQLRTFRVTRVATAELPVEVSGVQRVWSTPGQDNVKFSIKTLSEQELKVTVALFELGRKGETLDSKLNSNLSSWSVAPVEVTIPAGGGLAEFTLIFDQLEPGEYVGKLNLAAKGYKAKLHPFSVAVRYGPWCAALLVAVGAILALLLKRLSTQVRPRLVVRSAASKLLAAIVRQRRTNAMDPQELEVLDAIEARILEVLDETTRPDEFPTGWSDRARDRLAAEGTKVTVFTQWLNARRMLASITTMDSTKRTVFEQRLSAGRQALTSANTLDMATVDELSNLLGDIEEEKAELAQATVKAAVAEVATAVGVTTSPEAAAEFRKADENAQQANDYLAAANYYGYRMAYDIAGQAYYSGLAAEFQSRLTLAPLDDGRALALEEGVAPAPDLRPLLLAKVKSAPDLRTARDAYRDVRAAMLPTQGSIQDASSSAISSAPLWNGDFPEPPVREQRPLIPAMANTVIEDTNQLTATVKLLDNVVDGVAVFGAAALGVVLIWAPNAGWGGPNDLIAALLWGMGLHTVGSSTFQGILGLRSKLS